jgi:signal transduction histidine kinase
MDMEQPRFLQRIPLTVKMVFLTVMVGLCAGGVLDYFQGRTVRNIFMEQLKERFSLEAQEDRIRFDNYVKAHHEAVKLLTSQKRLIDYIGSEEWTKHSEVKFYRQPPPWLPRTSVLRALIRIRHALLLDENGKAWGIYQGIPESLPTALLHPTELLRQLSYNQSFMTTIEGKPFLVSSESLRDDNGMTIATLMLASPLDREFLLASQGTYHGRIFALLNFALLTGERPAVLISTEPDQLPTGVLVDDLKNRYLVTGESLFDYGASDLLLGFASFVPLEEVESLAGSVISRDRQQRAISISILIAAFGLIMFLITRRIGRLTARVSDFTERVLHGTPLRTAYGDEIARLEEGYQRLTEEVISSQEIIRRDYRFQRIISSILEMALEPVSLTEQLNRIMRAILSMPFLSPQDKGSIFLIAEDEPETLILKAQHGLPEPLQTTCAKVPFGKCLCGLAAAEREIVFGDCEDERHETICTELGSHGHYCVPIVSGDRTILGVMNLYVEGNHRRDPKEEELLISVVNTLAGIIQRHQAQHEMLKLQDELAQIEKLSALGRLTANVAHEIRNPLTLVGGFARRMSKKHAADDAERKYLDIIISEVDRLESILMNVLTFSKETRLDLEDHDINAIIDEVLNIYSDKLQDNSIHLEKSLTAAPHLPLDKAQIIGSLSNLVANAIDAMPEGGTLTITTREEILKDAPFLNMVISDTGTGIPEDKVNLIFEPFFTTKTLGRGTGLGLPICKRTIEDHGGSITLTSKTGEGSTFNIHLPYNQETDAVSDQKG